MVGRRKPLMCLCFEYVAAPLVSQTEVDEMTDDIVRELHEVIVSIGGVASPGKRSAKTRAQEALKGMRTGHGGQGYMREP